MAWDPTARLAVARITRDHPYISSGRSFGPLRGEPIANERVSFPIGLSRVSKQVFLMFPTVATSLLMAFGFGLFAIDFPAVQSLMLTGAAMAAIAFCCSFEAWDREEPAARASSKLDSDRTRDAG